ncbi:MAG: hypothetical protein KTR30_26010 [Saprospiraceae bacterium]|nr:hypothetical protein [Saprospiraceae bacterium]
MKTLSILVLFLSPFLGWSQKVYVDQPIRAGEVLLFPSVSDKHSFYYLPDKPRLSVKEGKPQMLFMRYVENQESQATQADASTAAGGGIFHALVNFEVGAERLEQARAVLQELDSEAVIKGPVVFTAGTVALISAVASKEGGHVKKVVGLGKAPLIEDQKSAVAFMLDKKGAQLLWNTFHSPTPDISFSFEMEVSGYRTPTKGWIKGNFDRIYSSHELGLGAKIPVYGIMLSGEIGAAFEKMRRDGAIEVFQEGDDKSMESFLQLAYGQLAELIFDRVDQDPNALQQLTQQQGLMGQVDQILGQGNSNATGEGSGANTPTSSGNNMSPPVIAAAYQYKRVKQSGDFHINFNKISSDRRILRFDENIGNIRRQCPNCLQTVNLYDPAFVQREVLVMLDGQDRASFQEYINFVAVQMRKRHGNAKAITHDEVRIDEQVFLQGGNRQKMLYGWQNKSDNNRSNWLDYEFKTSWNFHGGYTLDGEWQKGSANAIALSPPMHLQRIRFEADPDLVESNNIRLIQVKLYYDYGAGERQKQVVLRPGKSLSEELAIILPQGKYDYQYEVNWQLWDQSTKTSGRLEANSQWVFVDSLPLE